MLNITLSEIFAKRPVEEYEFITVEPMRRIFALVLLAAQGGPVASQTGGQTRPQD